MTDRQTHHALDGCGHEVTPAKGQSAYVCGDCGETFASYSRWEKHGAREGHSFGSTVIDEGGK